MAVAAQISMIKSRRQFPNFSVNFSSLKQLGEKIKDLLQPVRTNRTYLLKHTLKVVSKLYHDARINEN